MENRIITTYKDLNDWFFGKDFSIDTRVSIDDKLLKINKYNYLFEKDEYIMSVYPIELSSQLILLNKNEIKVFTSENFVKNISISSVHRPYLVISFYDSDDVLEVFSEKFIFQKMYQKPYVLPKKFNKNSVIIKILQKDFSFKTIVKKLEAKQIKVSLREYFGNEINFSEIKSIEDLQNISICQDLPIENSLQTSLGINICNIIRQEDYYVIYFDLQNTKMHNLWKKFLEVLLRTNIVEIKSGNIIYHIEEFKQFIIDFELDISDVVE